ncbi:MAG: DUF3379 family protein [Woeseiaceae bacterium]|nr:DUF3379 family protein [Woeseiaceae bacterium]
MNCKDYKQAIATDPSYNGGEVHVAECAACQAYRDDMQALERKIEKALALKVPELRIPELADIDTKNVVTLPARRRFTTPTWLAVAAMVVVAAFVGIRMYGNDVTYPSLSAEILAHLDHEPYALRVTDVPVSDKKLTSVVPASIANLNHDAGLITYAQTCVINGKDIPHLVIQGKRGPVTILLMPDEMVDGAVELHGESINGVILPVGRGSIAIIGESDENLQDIQKSVVNSVVWDT